MCRSFVSAPSSEVCTSISETSNLSSCRDKVSTRLQRPLIESSTNQNEIEIGPIDSGAWCFSPSPALNRIPPPGFPGRLLRPPPEDLRDMKEDRSAIRRGNRVHSRPCPVPCIYRDTVVSAVFAVGASGCNTGNLTWSLHAPSFSVDTNFHFRPARPGATRTPASSREASQYRYLDQRYRMRPSDLGCLG